MNYGKKYDELNEIDWEWQSVDSNTIKTLFS